jgi:hypothetical protein
VNQREGDYDFFVLNPLFFSYAEGVVPEIFQRKGRVLRTPASILENTSVK